MYNLDHIVGGLLKNLNITFLHYPFNPNSFHHKFSEPSQPTHFNNKKTQLQEPNVNPTFLPSTYLGTPSNPAIQQHMGALIP